MSRVSSLLVSASFLASIPFLALGTSGAQAGCAADCAADCGGTCERDGSIARCFCPEAPKPGPGKKLGTVTQEVIEGQGNLTEQPNPADDLTEDCTGNQGQCKQR
jgi:hypothetical protein